jgi:hypothetical protein
LNFLPLPQVHGSFRPTLCLATTPGGDPVIHLFPAWPKEWDASYRLLARSAFVVAASMRNGAIERVELESLAGSECRLRNPWGNREIVLRRDGRQAERLSGALVRFATRRGERIALTAG